jgi:hypothetical protein
MGSHPANNKWLQWTESPPGVADINGDGNLEIIVQTFGVGCFIYSVPSSSENMMLWPTGRGNYLRDGRPWRSSPKGDIDGNGRIDLADLICALQILTNVPTSTLDSSQDINGDLRLGLAEAIYLLQSLSQP